MQPGVSGRSHSCCPSCPPQLCRLTVSSGDLFSPLLLLVLLISMALFSIALRCSTLPMPALNPGCFRRVSPSCWLCPRLHLFFFLVGFCKDAIPGSFLQCVWWCHGAALPARASAWSSEALPQPGGVSLLSHPNPVITVIEARPASRGKRPVQRPGCPSSRVQVFKCLWWWKLSRATGPQADFMPPSFLAGTSGCLVLKCSRLPCRMCPPAVPAHGLLFSPALLQAACSPVTYNTVFL